MNDQKTNQKTKQKKKTTQDGKASIYEHGGD